MTTQPLSKIINSKILVVVHAFMFSTLCRIDRVEIAINSKTPANINLKLLLVDLKNYVSINTIIRFDIETDNPFT
jgi:hypothetical protein